MNNPEVLGARQKGIKVVHRSDILSKLMDEKMGLRLQGLTVKQLQLQ